jgi:Protein of unknown function (DUF2721)
MDIVPDTGQLSQVMVQATAPAFILGAVAGFISILLGQMTSVIDRVRSLNEIADGDTARAHLKSDIPRLRRRANLLNSATHLALAIGMRTSLLLVVGFGSAFFRLQHIYGAGILFALAVALLGGSLFGFNALVVGGSSPSADRRRLCAGCNYTSPPLEVAGNRATITGEGSEPLRDFRRLQSLRGWSDGEAEIIGSVCT